MALGRPDRVRSLAIFMSGPGELWAALPTFSGLRALMTRPTDLSRNGLIEHFVRSWGALGAHPHRTSQARLRELAAVSFDRGMSGRGFARQFGAIMAAPPRMRLLRKLRVPTVIVHGAQDPLIPPLAGRLMASQIPGARLVVIEGLGHDLGPSAWKYAIAALEENAHRKVGAGAQRLGLRAALTQRAVHV
jgi:pimeloyl-ACP methyl ester carboxylesterase